MPAMLAGTLVARPLTVLGATPQIAKCDGSTVSLRSAMTSLNIEGDGARTEEQRKILGLVKLIFFISYTTVSLMHSCMKFSRPPLI